MGSYRNDDEALIGLARQLTDAYGEARTREDQDYACESVAEFLSEFRDAAPSEALLAILDLPLTAETYPLVDEAQVALAARGPAVVELLLEAVLGDVYDPDGPAPERAAETLDLMDPGEASLGLCQVLCGRGDDQLKGAAVDGLVALGGLRRAGPRGHARRPRWAASGRRRRSSSCASSASIPGRSRTRRRSWRKKSKTEDGRPEPLATTSEPAPPTSADAGRRRSGGPPTRRRTAVDADDDRQPAGTSEAAEPARPERHAARTCRSAPGRT